MPFQRQTTRSQLEAADTMPREAPRILVYSHDTFGLGNIRRMLNVCEGLVAAMPDCSILLLTGSPMIHGFRLPRGLDYIKLPCLGRTERDGYSTKLLNTHVDDTVRLRSDIIKCAALAFDPHVVIVDKKPFGVRKELCRALQAVRALHPATKHVLVLRDILDSPEETAAEWAKNGFQDAAGHFDELLVLGSREVFDFAKEYRLPEQLAEKLHHCGYTRRSEPARTRDEVRAELVVSEDDRLVLVTPGGGEDGYAMIDAYVQGVAECPSGAKLKTLIVHGPEIPEEHRVALSARIKGDHSLILRSFTDDIGSYMNAADLVVAMGGYNTVCEILSLQKRAILVPRVRPVAEQLIRAERLERLGLLTMIHPDRLTPSAMMRAVLAELARPGAQPCADMDFDALPRVAARVRNLLFSRPPVCVPESLIKSFPVFAATR